MRISTTTLESFRLWSNPDQDWMSEEELIQSIRGIWTPTPRVELGQAFGHVLEAPERFAVSGGYQHGRYFFSADMMAPALAVFDRRGVFEAKATKQYGPHTVVAKADQLIGARIIENKTTLSGFNFDKYAESYQWRFMADIFEPEAITYHVFCLSEDTAGVTDLRSIETFNLFPYAACHEDCCALLSRFVEYVTFRGLDAHLNERQRAAEAAA